MLGFTTIFVALGVGASALGSLPTAFRLELNLIGGIIVIVFGLFTAGLLQLRWLQRELRWHGDPPGRGLVAAYLLGTAFAFGRTHCIGPVLGAILAVTASPTGSSGIMLLAVYSFGLGVPFVLAALFLSGFVSQLRALRRTGRALQIVAGGVMVVMGLAMITGHVASAAIWFIETFPALARIG